MTAAVFLMLAATSVTSTMGDGAPIEIVSDTMVLHPGSRMVTATGHVFAHGSTFDVHCDSGDTTYGEDPETRQRSIHHMVLRGHVRLRRFSDGMIADSNEATYDAEKAMVVLTGDPVATRGADVLRGDPIEMSTTDKTTLVQQPRVELVRPGKETTHVRAEHLTILDSGDRMKFDHNVQVRQTGFSCRSDHLDALLDPGETPQDPPEAKRLVFIGHVEAHRANQTGNCGKAVYDVTSTDLVMEDHPVVVQDGNILHGRVITLNNTTGVATAESADVDVPPSEPDE